MMRRGFPNTAVRPFAALAGAGILTLGLVTAPPVTAASLPRTEVHAIQLATFTAPAAAAVTDSVVAVTNSPAMFCTEP